jgi:hypothetical protein
MFQSSTRLQLSKTKSIHMTLTTSSITILPGVYRLYITGYVVISAVICGCQLASIANERLIILQNVSILPFIQDPLVFFSGCSQHYCFRWSVSGPLCILGECVVSMGLSVTRY